MIFPGQDFCEDTYRTYSHGFSHHRGWRSAKGVETQTCKLMEVCRMKYPGNHLHQQDGP